MSAKIRHSALKLMSGLHDEQLQGGAGAKGSNRVDQFRYEGEESYGINERIANALDISQLFELGVDNLSVADAMTKPELNVSGDKSMYAVAEYTRREVVEGLLDAFDAEMKALGIHDELNPTVYFLRGQPEFAVPSR